AKRLKLWVLGIQVFAGSCARCCEAAAECSPVETALAHQVLLRRDAANFVHSARPGLTLADRRRIGPRQELGSEQKFGSERNPPRAEARTGRLALVPTGFAGSTNPTSPHSVRGTSVILTATKLGCFVPEGHSRVRAEREFRRSHETASATVPKPKGFGSKDRQTA